MPILELEIEVGSFALMKKLAEAGFQVHSHDGANLNKCQIPCTKDTIDGLVEAIAKFICADWLYQYISGRVGVMHNYLNEDEREYVALLTFHGLRQLDEVAGYPLSTWQGIALAAVRDGLHRNVEPVYLNLDGVIRFRLRDLLTALDAGVNDMVEQFLADREYEEFVAMLRFMLDSQPSTEQLLHVFCTDERVWISDAAGALVRDQRVAEAAQQVSDNEEVNAEDLAMSILITHSPNQIVIHDLTQSAPWPSFAETVERVFLDRATRCSDCSACSQLQHTCEGRAPKPIWRQPAIPDKYD